MSHFLATSSTFDYQPRVLYGGVSSISAVLLTTSREFVRQGHFDYVVHSILYAPREAQ